MRRDAVSRIHALLRLLLPRDFRRAHAADMERVFRERVEEERRRDGVRGGVRAWWREGLDLADTGVRLRASDLRQGGGDMGGWTDDMRSALRSLRRSPGFAAFAVGTLALGTGATIAFASFFDRIVLRPVDFPGADRLVMAWRWREDGHLMISPDLDTRDRVRKADVFAGVAGMGNHDVAWSTDDGPRMLSAVFMDSELPALAGLPPLLGRYFDEDDLAGSGPPVAILAQGLWKRAFGADPGVLGRTLRIEGTARTIIGVAPEALRPPTPGNGDTDVFLPLPTDGSEANLSVFARLRDGVTLEHANEVMASLDRAATDADKSAWGTKLVPVAEMATSRLMSPLKVAGTAVVLLLLIACINVANLLLARGDARVRDTAVRAAVGAGRLRLAREMLFESLVIAGAASLIGLGLAQGAVAAFRVLRPRELTLLASLHLDPLVTAAAVACGVTTVLLFGVLPLVHRVRTRPGAVLTERGGTADGSTLAVRRLLMVGEVALSFALLAGGVQVMSTLMRAGARDPGLDVPQLLAATLKLPAWRFPDDASREAALDGIVARVRRLPGVEGASLASSVPTRSGIYFGAAEAEGNPVPEDARGNAVFFGNSVEPGYFATVGQAVLQGRAFTDDDVKADPTPYILGESAAKKYFPGGGAVGGRFRMGSDGDWHPVVGVVRDVWTTGSVNEPGYPQLYMPRTEGEGSAILVRTRDPGALAGSIAPLVRDVDKEIPVLDVQPVAHLYRQALARERMVAVLLAAFAVTAALLAAVGLYGVVSQVAVRRTREFGIRISLGAERRSIFTLALRGGVRPVVAGLMVGSALAWAGLRFVKMGIAGLAEASPLAFLGAALLLAVTTLVAMGVPAARAARTDAIEALRAE